jgi:beta-glucanase (GH16 family)
MSSHRSHNLLGAFVAGSALALMLLFMVSASPPVITRETISSEPSSQLLESPTTQSVSSTTHLPLIFKTEPVWRDEFSGSGSLDSVDWICDVGTGYPGGPPNWGTGEIEVMSCDLNNLFQSNGYLHIRALHAGTNPLTGWTSSRIETVRTDFEPPDGGKMTVEARIRLPDVAGAEAQGYWPAFWLLGAPFRGNYWNWPGVGEVDIMENINGLNRWWGVLHCGINPGGPCNERTGLAANVSGFSPSLQSDFHIYRIEFDKGSSLQQLRWYVDGVQRHSVSSDAMDSVTWSNATDHGFFIIFNVAIGGGWPGQPTSSTISAGTMLVDYVRVFTQTVGPP